VRSFAFITELDLSRLESRTIEGDSPVGLGTFWGA